MIQRTVGADGPDNQKNWTKTAYHTPPVPIHNFTQARTHVRKYSTVLSQHIWHTRASSVTSLTVWNSLPDWSLPDSLRDPAIESEHLRRDSKTHLVAGH